MFRSGFFALAAAGALCAAPLAAAGAGQTQDFPPIVVTGTRIPMPDFDVPAAISVVTQDEIQHGPPSSNLAASLARVPGIVAQNRLSYAQDLQISLRGFGARASFGVRGIRLLVDGIPASFPDGQGQTDIFDLAVAQRIEVLRGPFSALYGNAAGGVIQVFTEDGPPQPTVTGALQFGSFGTRVQRLQGGGTDGNLNYIVDLSHFYTAGYREHSAAERDHLRGKFRYTLGDNSSLTLLVNGENQPFARDPSGLTRAQMAADPRQAVDRVFQFGAGESHRHRQGGIVYEQQIDRSNSLHVTGWLGSRRVIQFLPFSGDDALGGGAAVDLDNNFGGGNARWTHSADVAGFPFTFTAGLEYERLLERRKGYVNDNGVEGDLRRNEDDVSSQRGEYLQGHIGLGKWRLTAGVRHTRVNFDSDDHLVTAIDPNDSGSQAFSSTDPVAGVLYQVNSNLNLYANYGRGFQTPTFAEIGYRPNGTAGLNLALEPSTSRNYETGLKAQPWRGGRLKLALFRINTDNEIVVANSDNGRTTFRNAGSTEREGAELSFDDDLGGGFRGYVAYSYLHAVFAQGPFDGARLPGVPRQTVYGELSWQYQPLDFNASLDAQWRDRVYVNDENSDFADSYVVVNLQAGFHQQAGDWQFEEFARINNLFDRRYVGAVIVDAGNGRFFEPAPNRNYLVGANLSYAF